MPMKFVHASSQSPRSWILHDVRCCCDNTSEPSAALGSSLMLKSGTDVVIGEGGSKAAISTNWPATTLSTIELEMVDQNIFLPGKSGCLAAGDAAEADICVGVGVAAASRRPRQSITG